MGRWHQGKPASARHNAAPGVTLSGLVLLVACALMACIQTGLANDRLDAAGGDAGGKVSQVVRNDLGEMRWMVGKRNGYTAAQAAGRAVFESSGCVYCHSRAAEPGTEEGQRLGTVAGASSYAAGLGFGPNLSQVGLKYADDWHRAHFWDPDSVLPGSPMPRFIHFFDGPYGPVNIVGDNEGNRTVERTPDTEKLFDFSSDRLILLTPNEAGLAFVRELGRYPVIHTPNDEYTGDTVTLVAGTERLDNLIAYLQTLGTERGKWRELSLAHRLEFSEVELPESEELISQGRTIYQQNCIGCHGETGNGNGPAATFMEVRPRNFQYALFKFRLTPTGSLPIDGDLMRTLTRGVRGTSMPSFHDRLRPEERLAVIQYVKNELAVDRYDPDDPYAYFIEEEPDEPFSLWLKPRPTMARVEAGRAVWEQAKCWECHGREGRGDGEKAAGLEDDFGYPIRPANLTTGLFKSGVDIKDIYRTVTTGLNGTPMPTYADSLTDDDRWALAYFVMSLSAFKDPLTGQPLELSYADRAVLNNPELGKAAPYVAYEPHVAYEPRDDLCVHRQGNRLPVPGFCE